MSRYLEEFSEEIIIQIIRAYLYERKSHRDIQREILHIPAPDRGGGFIAMDILHYFDIHGDKKGFLVERNLDQAIMESEGSFKRALQLLKESQVWAMKSHHAIESRSFVVDNSKTEIMGQTKIRISQNILRDYVLDNYNYQCALCGINQNDLLVCSHIKPWSIDEENRLNPANAVCLCVLHDRLFDRGYFSLDDEYQVVYGPKSDQSIIGLLDGLIFKQPKRDKPRVEFLQYHYEEICWKGL